MNPQYKKDSQGRLVPIENIAPVDLLRDDLVHNLLQRARELSRLIAQFKQDAFDEIEAFCELSSVEYGVQHGGKKGNLKLTTYDGEYYVQRAVADRITFDERLQTAKILIDECLNEWSGDARPELKTLITDAFQVDKTGKIATGKILSLRRLDIKDAKWLRAMEALSDSLQVLNTATYLRFYKRLPNGEYQHIPLDQ